MNVSYTLFPTAIGDCGIAWSDDGVTWIQLPEATPEATETRLRAKNPGGTRAPATRLPAWVDDAVRAIEEHVSTTDKDQVDLSSVRLDFTRAPPFHKKVYEAARGVLSGTTVTYAELATLAGSPKAVRAVGQAMAKNPYPIVIPCHRILAKGNTPGGFSAFGGAATKAKLLAGEGAPLDPLATLSTADPVLGRLIAKVGAFALEARPAKTTFDALSHAIVYQQLTGKAAATIHARVVALFKAKALRAEDVHGASDELLRSAGLSRAKAASLKDLADKVLSGSIPTLEQLGAMDDEAVIEKLITVRGIGRWTVEMLLMFRLARLDVLPVNDYGIKKGFPLVFKTKELPDAATMTRRAERWRPWRSIASWYLWRALELPTTTLKTTKPKTKAKAKK
jgi:methylated-DNA-[protein]-cysteine S-methyltransferase